jgi:uncharacterized protein (TIGR03435 family)
MRMKRWLWPAYLLLYAGLCPAQTEPAPPAFEAAAIKPSKAGDNSSHWRSGKGRITMDNLSVKQIIMSAYRVKDFQVTGPGWIDAERYHIDAKADADVDDDKLLPMLQTLLAERFHLAFHRDKKEVAAYALTPAKGGMKIHAVEGTGSQSNSTNGKMTAKHLSMARFADFLSRQLAMPVVDETGAAGGFDFTLEFSNERQQKAAEADGGVPAAPSLFTALPEQLGLKLTARKVQVDVMVVDRVERPSEN